MRPTWTLHGAIRLGMVLIFAILVFQVTAASLRPPTSSRVYGSPVVALGATARFYISCLDTDGLTPCPKPSATAQWVVRPSAEAAWRNVGPQLAADARGAVRLDVPTRLQDQALGLSVQVFSGRQSASEHIVVALEPQQTPHTQSQTLWPRGRFRAPIMLRCSKDKTTRATLWPNDGALIAGLPAEGLGQLESAGIVRVRKLRALAPSALVPEGPSDAQGMWRWRAEPQLKKAPWQLALMPELNGCTQLQADVAAEPRQLSLALKRVDGAFVAKGAPLEVSLRTLPFKGPVHVDVWWGNALIDGVDMTQGQARLSLPTYVHGPLMLTAYRQSMAPDDTHVTQLAWALSGALPTDEERSAMGAFLGLAPRHAESAALAARVGMFVPDALGAPLLADTHALRQTQFRAAQQQRRRLGQRSLVTVFAFGGFCALGYLRHFRLRRNEALMAQAQDAEDRAAARAMTAVGVRSWLWPAIGILLLMGAGLWELMEHWVHASL